MTHEKHGCDDVLQKFLIIPADATPEQAQTMLSGAGAALKAAKERQRELWAIRRPGSRHRFDYEHAVELAESIGYDKSKTSGEKAIAYLMRADVKDVRNMLKPDVDSDGDQGGTGIDVDQIIADAMKP